METSITYIISQIFLIFNYTFLLLTYHVKEKKSILIFSTISTISEAIGFLLLWALSWCSMILLALIRNILFWYGDKKNSTTLKNASLTIILFSIIIFSIITYNWLYTILPGISWIIYLYSIRQKNIKTYRILWIPVALCWILYSFYIYSIVWIIWDSCILVYIIYNLSKTKHIQNKINFLTILNIIWPKKLFELLNHEKLDEH